MSEAKPLKASDMAPEAKDTDQQAEIDALSKKVSELEKALQEAKNEQLRLIAEIRNQSQRFDRKLATDIKRAARYFITDLLPSLDGLQKAIIASKKDDASLADLTAGIEMTQKEIEKVLTQHHVTIIKPGAEKFNPDIHEALATIPSDQEANTILEVIQTGYQIDDMLIRAAKVIVAAKNENEPLKKES